MGQRKAFEFEVDSEGCFVCNSHTKHRDGHIKTTLDGKTIYAHRYIYEQCFGAIPAKEIIRHTCGNPACINPEHLVLGERKHFTFNVDANGCFVCTSHSKHKDGHAKFSLNGKNMYIHRYIYEQCFGSIPKGKVVRHTCDNPSCINPEHLLLGYPADNVQDRVSRKRSASGTKNGRAKLNPTKVLEIRKSNLTTTELSRLYGVDRKVIYEIKAHKTWKDVI